MISPIVRHVIAVTTAADGTATAYSAKRLVGFIQRIRYVPDDTTPLAATADIAITAEDSGAAILSLTDQAQLAADYAPRMPTHSTAGAAALYAAAGAAVNALIPLANERIKIVVAQGGNVLKGAYHVYVGG